MKMKISAFAVVLIVVSFTLGACKTQEVKELAQFHKLSATSIYGETIKMEKYLGDYVLIVNTASKCGYTGQYDGLEDLYKEYKDRGFQILGFPCNQFGAQEPGSDEDIENFCRENYGVTFQMFSKIDVNGANEHPIYTFLKSKKAGDIKWNFTKFLVDPNGEVIERYESAVSPSSIGDDLVELL